MGKWWLADKADNRVGGVLEISSDGTAHLEVVDELVGEQTVELIHGHAAGKMITLVNSFRTGGNVTFGQAFTATEKLRSSLVFIGVHLTSEMDKIFNYIEVEISCLTSFASRSGLEYATTIDRENGHFKNAQVTVEIPETLVARATARQQQVEIYWTTKSSSFGNFTYGRDISFTETAKLRVRADSPSSWNEFDKVIGSVQNLVTLASQQGCAVRSRKLAITQEGRAASVELYFSKADTWTDAKTERHRFLFHLPDLGADYDSALNRWFSLGEEIGIALDALFSLDYTPTVYYQNELFNLASAAEGFHAKLFPESTAHDPEMRSEIVRAAMQAFSEHPEKSWVKGRLSDNRPGLKKRLLELAALPDREAVENLLGSIDTWAKWLRDARNAIGHMDTGELEKKIPEDARYRLSYVTKALLHLVLLQKLGISSELQSRAVADIYGYSAREFRKVVAEAAQR
ncbi:ApeA N-terminal domain 1-containing protein [Nocardia pseudovaccinii]|uniref:ApeA N-terminal domain 1-containing protein n=1 Tax=Nocardia pseudovaccinii TaxID=189540 RepID=UPI0012F4E48D|nr:HEPN domain-containing protein [Nocardia pseudovaccinii]